MTFPFLFEMTVPYPIFVKMCGSPDILISSSKVYWHGSHEGGGSMLVTGQARLEALNFYMACTDVFIVSISGNPEQ